MSDVTDRT